MQITQIVHIAIEGWGLLFCIVSLITVIMTRYFDRVGSTRLILTVLCSAALMISDATAWICQAAGSGEGVWYTLLKISYFFSFIFGFLLMPLAAEYVSHVIFRRTKGYRIYWNRVEWVIFLIGAILISINEFHPYIYYITEECEILHLPFFHYIPFAVVFAGIFMTLFVAIVYMRFFTNSEKIAIVSFLILPIIGAGLSFFIPGISLIKLAAVVSTIIMIISYEVSYIHHLIRKEKQIAEEKIRTFNMQMHPHFVFNTLALIRHLCVHSPDDAVEAINDFSKIMRSTTDYMSSVECIGADRELELVKSYVNLQKKNYGNSMIVEYDIEDTDFDLPPFSIQTLVENAIHHGLKNGKIKGAKLKVSMRTDGEGHIVEVADNGAGFDTSKIEESENSVGIKNTIKRVETMCGGTVEVISSPDNGTKVTMSFPAVT